MSKKFDVIVIGSGPGGSQVVKQLLKEDKKIVIVDYLYGGTCALRGCTPKKAMESVTSQIWKAKALEVSGFPTLHQSAEWQDLVNHQRQFTELVSANTKANWRKKGVTVIEGVAEFTGKKTIKVGKDKYSANHIVIATGAKPRPLDMDGAEYMLESEDFFNLEKLPRSIVFAGGGYVAFELAHIAAAAGSQVTIVSSAEKPLSQFDPDLVNQLVKSALKKGISVRLGYEVIGIRKKGEKYTVVTERSATGDKAMIVTSCVFNTTGRVPALEKLNLDKAEIEYDEQGIKVDDYLQTTNNYVYAIGDVTGKYPLTPVAGLEGKIAAQNIIKEQSKKMEYTCIPSALYTYPKMASVGKSEQQLLEEGVEFQKKQGGTADWLTESALNNDHAGFKILLSEDGEKVLGAHLIGAHAHNVINIFAIAIQMEVPVQKIRDSVFTYPTAMSDIQTMLAS